MHIGKTRLLRQNAIAGFVALIAGTATADPYMADPSRFSGVDCNTIAKQIDGKFISGVNIGSTGEQYGIDLGPNHVFPRTLFRGSTPPAGAVAGGPNYTAAGGPAVVGEAASTSDAGNTIVRIFVFEGAQGLNFGSDGRVTGYDDSVVTNLKTSLGILQQNQKAILVLTDPATDFSITGGTVPIIRNVENGINKKYDGTTLDGTIIGGDGNVRQIADFYTDHDARSQFEQNAVQKLVAALHDQGFDSKIFAYDVANEYNNLTGATLNGNYYTGASDKNGSEYVIKNFINDTSDAVKAGGYQGHITASSAGFADPQIGYNTDFVDVHAYPGDEVNDLATFEAKTDAQFFGGVLTLPASSTKPFILGESGGMSLSKDDQGAAEQRFAEDAIKAGYTGFLPWVIGATTVSNSEPFTLTTANGDGSFTEYSGYKVLKDLNARLAQCNVL